MLLAAGAGTAFGLISTLIRVLAAQLPGPLSGPVLPTAAAVVAFLAVGVLLCQNAYRDGGLGAPLATLTVLDPLVASLIGITVFGEAFPAGLVGLLTAALAAVTATTGVIIFARRPLHEHGICTSTEPCHGHHSQAAAGRLHLTAK